MGSRRLGRQTVYFAGTPRNCEIAGKRARKQPAPLHHFRQQNRIVRRPRHRPESRPRPCAPGERRFANGYRAARRRAGHRHDRPGLGARDETCSGHCDQPRRTHLPRSDYCTRIGHSRRCRLRQRFPSAARRAGSDRVMRRGRYRPDLPRPA